MWNGLFFDIRYAFRVLPRNRGFAALSILTLAVGLAANSAIFAVVNGVLLRRLPFADPDRLVSVTRITGQGPDRNHAAADFIDVGRESRSFSSLAGYRMDVADLSGDASDPERVPSAEVTAAFFDTMGVPAQVGRTFSANDSMLEPGVVLSHDLWRRRFGADRRVVGRPIRLNRELRVVLGVMPASFRFPGDAEVWVMAAKAVPSPPLTVEGDLLADRQVHYFEAVARLKESVSTEQATSELGAIATRLGERYPQTNGGQGLEAVPLHRIITRETRAGLLILMAAVAFVLLVACANVAGLVLARVTGRRQELALRSALGAGRARLVRQLLVESLLLGLAGAGLGLLLAWWGLDALLALVPQEYPRLHEVRLDGGVMLFTLGLGMGTALLFGVLPALVTSRTDITTALRAGEIRGGGSGTGRAMSALVVLEVVAGVVLSAGAGLMVKTLLRLEAVDPGYRTSGVVRVPLPVPSTRYGTSEQQAQFYSAVLEKLAANPVTRMSAAAFPLPLSGGGASGGVQVEGRPWVNDRERPLASITWISPGYFKVLGIPIARGRDLGERDVRTAPPVAVISRAAAARLWADEDPVGKRFTFGDIHHPTWITVVGVAADVRHSALADAPGPMLYFPLRQDALPFMSLLVRSDAGVAAVTKAVRTAVRQLDPELPVGDAADFSTVVSRSLGEPRLRARLLSGFATTALLLAATGVYGLLSYSVARRRREIGIRLALGARPSQVFRGVVGQGMKLAALGLAVGVPAAVGLSRLVASQLFGIGPGDPLTLAAVCLVLGVVAAVACWVPATRAIRIDPVTALRAD